MRMNPRCALWHENNPAQGVSAPDERMLDREDEVRAPIPVKRDRLYGDGYYASRPTKGGNHEKRAVEAFRDFECALRSACLPSYVMRLQWV